MFVLKPQKERDEALFSKRSRYFKICEDLAEYTGFKKNEVHELMKEEFLTVDSTKDFTPDDWDLFIANIIDYFYLKLDIVL